MIPEGEYVTIAGFILDLAGEIPAAGTTYNYEDWTFRVQSVEKRRISEIVVEYHEPAGTRRSRRHLTSASCTRPAPATRIIGLRGNSLRAVAQLGSALRSGRRGPGFKSRQPDHHSSTR